MSIITYLGKDITDYITNRNEYLKKLHFYCPEHGHELVWHTSYSRNKKDYGITISIQRVICPCKRCNYTQAVLPDFLQPNKHYSAYEITHVMIEADTSDTALEIDTEASISTVRRWITQYRPIIDEKISRLKAMVIQVREKVVNEASLSAEQPMAMIHKLLKCLPAINYTNTIGAAYMYSNALAIPK